ncbi:hypothetical protein FB451DRAFT_1164118 [Mycena latifolia]|nr:hypothetical protein FB451DRAFT_1164118 [Mycena latifolia]
MPRYKSPTSPLTTGLLVLRSSMSTPDFPPQRGVWSTNTRHIISVESANESLACPPGSVDPPPKRSDGGEGHRMVLFAHKHKMRKRHDVFNRGWESKIQICGRVGQFNERVQREKSAERSIDSERYRDSPDHIKRAQGKD